MAEQKEQWEELEELDSHLIIQNDVSTQVYYHKLSSSYDYTLNGWTRLANENLISIVDVKVEDLEKMFRVTAIARRFEWHKNAKQLIEIDRVGGQEENKIARGKPDEFAYAKALSKGQRNAYKAHLKGHASITQERLKAIYDEQKKGNKESTPAQKQSAPSNQQSPPAQQQSQNGGDDADYTSTKRKEMFATFTEHKATLATMGIDEKVLAEGMYARFEVKSRADMTADQYLSVTKALRYVSDDGELYAEWISALGTEPDVGESESTAKIADEEKLVSGDDIPFDDEQPYGSALAEQLGSKDRDELAKQTKALIAERLPKLKEIGVDADMLILGAFVKYDVKPDKGEKLSKEQLIEVIESLSYTTFPGWIQNLPVDNSTNL